MDANQFKYDDTGLRFMAAVLRAKTSVKVGILKGNHDGKDTERHDGSGLSNAAVGAVHEYGSFTGGFGKHPIPRRSFLHDPLKSKRLKILDRAKRGFLLALKGAPAVDFWDAIGAEMVRTVLQSFANSGPGWAPLSPVTIALRKRAHKGRNGGGEKPLIDTGELRKSISFRVDQVGGQNAP